ncbi:hypothetical protein CEXT_17591 [Caerostris extrusa]|uniref:Uncharacterized protein n=1 Tax=Caerostris extrusa TaxID=172846 RepID=A0AAV4RMY3_CAEEX|nr:hypothetical protein CEXT_17591 [Caerostris extrusa]
MTVKLQNIYDEIDEVIRSAQDTAVEPTVMTTNLQKIRDEVKEYFAHTHGGNNEPCSEDDIPEQDDKGKRKIELVTFLAISILILLLSAPKIVLIIDAPSYSISSLDSFYKRTRINVL